MNTTIPRLKDSDPASADTFNKPLDAIESILKSLDKGLSSITSGASIIAKTVPISEDCRVGSLVYFNDANAEFSPAIASVEYSQFTPGSLMISKKSTVVGMVTAITGNKIGDILIQGRHTSHECVANCLQSSAPGAYYLSDTNPGKASTTYSTIVQPVLTYIGGDDFILNITHQMPYQYSGSVIRGVSNNSELLRTEVNKDGVLVLDTNTFTLSGESLSPYAISSIDGMHYRRTPVITNAIGVGKIHAVINPNGELTIGDVNSLGGKIQAYEYNLNGAVRSSDNIYTYIVFPARRQSSVTFNTHILCDSKVQANVWIHTTNSQEDSNITANVYVVYDPQDGVESAMPGTPTSSFAVPLPGCNGSLAQAVSTESVELERSCYVFVELSYNGGPSDIRMLDAGLIITPSDNTYIGLSDRDRTSLTESGIATEDISKDDIVGVDKYGNLLKASCDNDEVRAVGISIGNFRANSMCTYTTYGTHTTGSELIIGAPYFVGLDGEITGNSPDYPSYTQCIGVCTGPNQIRVDIEDRIL